MTAVSSGRSIPRDMRSVHTITLTLPLCATLPVGPWSAFRSWYPWRHGYGRLEVVNATHVHWEQVVDGDMTVEDEIWIEQHSHGPFG